MSDLKCSRCKELLTLKNSFPSVVRRGIGLCKICSKEYCNSRRKKRTLYNANYYKEHKTERKVYDAVYRKNHPLEVAKYAAKSHQKIRLLIFTHYCGGSPFCQCPGCPIRFIEGLSIDHKNRQRGAKKTGVTLWRWLRNNRYPKGFQVLCGSCNQAKGRLHRCPAYGKDHTKVSTYVEYNQKRQGENMIVEPRKEFEKPETGEFNATIVDVVDLGKVKRQYGEKVQIRIIWALGLPDGSGRYAVDSEGKPFRVFKTVNATLDERGKLYDLVKSILGTAPPVPFDSEILMGRSNKLFVEKAPDPKTGIVYANVKFITFLTAGHIPPPIPQGFVRAKDKPANTYSQSGAPRVASAAGSVGTTQTSQPTTYGQATNTAPVAQAAAPAPQPTSAAPAQQQVPAPQPQAPAPQPQASAVDAQF
jgi:hypothetical protein